MQPQPADDVFNDGLDRRVDRYGYRVFCHVWRLERPELAGEQAWRHEMVFAPGEAVRNQWLGAVEKDDADVAASVHQNIAVSALQRRAGDHRTLASQAQPVDFACDR